MSKPEKDQELQKQSRAVAPWRPFAELPRWEREMDRMFEDFFTPRWSLFKRGPLAARARGIAMPSVDIDVFERGDEVIAKAELPGMSKDEISINVADHTLTIKGEKKREEDVKEEDYHYSERSYGAFMRAIELPVEVQTDKAKASFKDGVLEIRLPKTEEAKRKAITVKVE